MNKYNEYKLMLMTEMYNNKNYDTFKNSVQYKYDEQTIYVAVCIQLFYIKIYIQYQYKI